jgi:hypothetical protein
MAMVIVGPLTPSGPENHTYILVMGENLTRYTTVASMPDSTAESIAKAFYKNTITRHGVPEMILTDQGLNFLSKVMDGLYKQYGVEAMLLSHTPPVGTSAYRHHCDDMVKRANRTLAEIIYFYVKDNRHTWTDFLDVVPFVYNTAVHSSTGYSPFYLMFVRKRECRPRSTGI